MPGPIFEKVGNSFERGWHLFLYNTHWDILPEADDQGPYPTCVFHSHAKGGQMSIHRAYANAGRPCDIICHARSLIKDFLVLNNMSSEDIWLIDPEADTWNRELTAAWIITTLGVESTSYSWDGPRHITMKSVNHIGVSMPFEDLVRLLDDGKPVLASMIADSDFSLLGDDEIYSCTSEPRFDQDSHLLEPHCYHMVVLVGHGKAEGSGREIVAFLNSHSKRFGKDGVGRLYFDEVESFFCVESDYRPNILPRRRQQEAPPVRERRYIDAQKWHREGKYVAPRTVQDQSERSGRSDSDSNWQSKKNQEAVDADNGKDLCTVLKNAILTESPALMAHGVVKQHVREGMSMAFCSALTNLEGMAIMINSPERMAQVATYSAHGESKIGNLISNALDMVGKDGIVTIMDDSHRSTELEAVSGLKLDRGYVNPCFITNLKTKKCELKNPLVLICANTISSFHANILWNLVDEIKRDLLIISKDIEVDALETLVMNKLYSGRKICVVKVPGSGQTRELNLKSVAIFTGGTILRGNHDMELIKTTMLGNCKLVTVSQGECVLLYGATTKQLEEEIGRTSSTGGTFYSKEMLHDRMANLLCTVAVLKVGGASRVEVDENKARVTAALTATKSALEAGAVPGDGYALLYASKYLDNLETENPNIKIGVKIIQNALRAPVYLTLTNAALDGSLMVDTLLEQDNMHLGWDADGQYVDMVKAGLIEPYLDIKRALQAVEFEIKRLI